MYKERTSAVTKTDALSLINQACHCTTRYVHLRECMIMHLDIHWNSLM